MLGLRRSDSMIQSLMWFTHCTFTLFNRFDAPRSANKSPPASRMTHRPIHNLQNTTSTSTTTNNISHPFAHHPPAPHQMSNWIPHEHPTLPCLPILRPLSQQLSIPNVSYGQTSTSRIRGGLGAVTGLDRYYYSWATGCTGPVCTPQQPGMNYDSTVSERWWQV